MATDGKKRIILLKWEKTKKFIKFFWKIFAPSGPDVIFLLSQFVEDVRKGKSQRREEESFAALKAEVAKVRDNVEKMLALFCESSANQARTNYSGLEMY